MAEESPLISNLTTQLEHAHLLNRVMFASTAALDASSVLQTICDELASLFHFPQIGVALFDPDQQMMTVVANHTENNTSTIGARFPVVAGDLSDQVLQSAAPVIVYDIQHDPRTSTTRDLLAQQQLRSIAVIPIWSQGTIIGTLGLATYHHFDFHDQLVALIEQLASAASRALYNATLFSDVQQELQRRRDAEALIQAQQSVLNDLSTPLLVLDDHVVLMPLIGLIDGARAQHILDVLLHGVQQQQARIALLDITGVGVVDTQVAGTLLQAAQALKLLGSRVMLTGIRPEIAQTLVGLGVNLEGIECYATLQRGVAVALRARF